MKRPPNSAPHPSLKRVGSANSMNRPGSAPPLPLAPPCPPRPHSANDSRHEKCITQLHSQRAYEMKWRQRLEDLRSLRAKVDRMVTSLQAELDDKHVYLASTLKTQLSSVVLQGNSVPPAPPQIDLTTFLLGFMNSVTSHSTFGSATAAASTMGGLTGGVTPIIIDSNGNGNGEGVMTTARRSRPNSAEANRQQQQPTAAVTTAAKGSKQVSLKNQAPQPPGLTKEELEAKQKEQQKLLRTLTKVFNLPLDFNKKQPPNPTDPNPTAAADPTAITAVSRPGSAAAEMSIMSQSAVWSEVSGTFNNNTMSGSMFSQADSIRARLKGRKTRRPKCPEGVDPDLFKKVLTLRERRLRLEEEQVEIRRILEELQGRSALLLKMEALERYALDAHKVGITSWSSTLKQTAQIKESEDRQWVTDVSSGKLTILPTTYPWLPTFPAFKDYPFSPYKALNAARAAAAAAAAAAAVTPSTAIPPQGGFGSSVETPSAPPATIAPATTTGSRRPSANSTGAGLRSRAGSASASAAATGADQSPHDSSVESVSVTPTTTGTAPTPTSVATTN